MLDIAPKKSRFRFKYLDYFMNIRSRNISSWISKMGEFLY